MKKGLILLTLFCLVFTGCGKDKKNKSEITNITTNEPAKIAVEKDTELNVTFLNVEQGDCTLLESNGEYMLIDAGDDNTAYEVLQYMQNQNIESFKYVVGTHPDDDHIGGLDVIIDKFECDNIFMPNISASSKSFTDLMQVIKAKDKRIVSPNVDDTYFLGDAVIKILGPVSEYDDDNNSSIVLMVYNQENSFLFTGDIEKDAENDLLNSAIKADVIKIAHHGSSSSSTEDFIKKVSPTYAVISCGINNDYGHPHAETLNTLRMNGIEVFRTDIQGTIIAKSDGHKITWNMSPDDSWISGENFKNESLIQDGGAKHLPDDITNAEYILNTKTKKFHLLTCESVNDMNESNKKKVNKTRDEIINDGYEPCKNCNP